MKLLIFWDIFWRVGRNTLISKIEELKKEHKPDFVIANVDNLSSWRWPILDHIRLLEEAGIDLMTSGDHFWDNQKKIAEYISEDTSRLIRPANYFESRYFEIPGKGYKIIEKNKFRLLVIHVLSGTFTKDDVYNPFLKIDEILEDLSKESFSWIIIDFHKETTSETYAMWNFLDWRVSLVYWTHTHVQTNDEQVLPNGTWILSDVWMTGPLNTVIGMDYESLKNRFLTWIQRWKMEQWLWPEYVLNALNVEIDEKNWKCLSLEKIRIRGK